MLPGWRRLEDDQALRCCLALAGDRDLDENLNVRVVSTGCIWPKA